MMTSAFKQVDVFSAMAFRGNPLAVLLDADAIAGEDMQRIAAWTNLSETAFVLAPTQAGASFRVRIFTPRSELPFAGHPSIGTIHALLEAGRLDASATLVQECAAGLLPVRVVGDGAERRVFVRAPRARAVPTAADDVDAFVAALGARIAGSHAPRTLSNGPDWLICDLGDEATVRALRPDFAAIDAISRRSGVTGVSVFGRASAGAGYDFVVRAFAPADGVPEDPVTGSANAAIGAFLLETGQLGAGGATYRASQGREVGRDGIVEVGVGADGEVEIGGRSVTTVDGMMRLDAPA